MYRNNAVLLVLLLCVGLSTAAQEDAPDYLRNPTLPPFILLGVDSIQFTKADVGNKKTLIMLFNPDCGHCRALTDSIIGNIDKLKEIQIVMTSFDPLPSLRTFYDDFKLKNYQNIKLGRDIRYFFTPYYEATAVPFLALYNEKGKFITKFDSGVPVSNLLEAYNNN